MLNDTAGKGVITGISNIYKEMYDVVKVSNYVHGEIYNQPDTYTVYKETGGNPLGTVKEKYFPIQPSELLSATVDCIEAINGNFSELQFRRYKDDDKISFRFPIGKIYFNNILGKQDETECYANIFNGYNGATSVKMYISTYRLICKNGMKAWKSEYVAGFMNTENNKYKADVMLKNFMKLIDSTETLQDHWQLMNKIPVDSSTVNEFVRKALNIPVKIAYADLSTRARNNYDKAMGNVEVEFMDTGSTVFGLLNGITRFTNHGKPKENLDEYIMLDTGAKINQRAQILAEALI